MIVKGRSVNNKARSKNRFEVETEIERLYTSGRISKTEYMAGLAWADDAATAPRTINGKTKPVDRPPPIASSQLRRDRYIKAWKKLINVLGDELADYVRGVCIRQEKAQTDAVNMQTMRHGLIVLAFCYGLNYEDDLECKRIIDENA